MTPTVLVHYDKTGEASFKISGDVALIIVDEASPSDRAYRYQTQTPLAEIMAIVGEEIGTSDDARHKALTWKIERAAQGLPALQAVK